MTPNPAATSAEEFHTQVHGLQISEKRERVQLVYTNVLIYLFYHVSAVYGLYLGFTSVKWQTIALGVVLWMLSVLGITVGAHRLWTHRSYKARAPLQVTLLIWNSISCHLSCYNWVRDHRLHHKYTDTNADPHNARRGFFFSHIGWLMCKKHSEVKRLGGTVYMDDVYSNPLLMFQKKYAIPFMGTICYVLPTLIPMYLWGESFSNAFHFNILRFLLGVHSICSVNSFAHLWGSKPYDRNMWPVENAGVSLVSLGEGYHNYHHAFPWDYKAGELGNNWLNLGTLVIDFFAWIGWAYDLKSAPGDMIRTRALRTGDGSYKFDENKNK